MTRSNTTTEQPDLKPPCFTALPNWMRGRFTPNEFALIWCLMSYWPDRCPSIGQLAEDTGLSVPSIHRLMRVLECDGAFRRVPRYDQFGAQLTNGYEMRIWDEGAEAATRGNRG